MEELKCIIQDIRSGVLPRSALPKFIIYQLTSNLTWISIGMVIGLGISFIIW